MSDSNEQGVFGVALSREDYVRLKGAAELLNISFFDGMSFAISLLEQAALDPDGRAVIEKSRKRRNTVLQ